MQNFPIHWHRAHAESQSVGDGVADKVALFIGSWDFLIVQAFLMGVWVFGNALVVLFHFDPYPFVFLNLFMSAEAAFSTPLVLMSQNRQSSRDRIQADADYHADLQSLASLHRIETLLELNFPKLYDGLLQSAYNAEAFEYLHRATTEEVISRTSRESARLALDVAFDLFSKKMNTNINDSRRKRKKI